MARKMHDHLVLLQETFSYQYYSLLPITKSYPFSLEVPPLWWLAGRIWPASTWTSQLRLLVMFFSGASVIVACKHNTCPLHHFDYCIPDADWTLKNADSNHMCQILFSLQSYDLRCFSFAILAPETSACKASCHTSRSVFSSADFTRAIEFQHRSQAKP